MEKKEADLLTHEGPVNRLAFCPDGKRLASASDDGTVRLWDVATGKELYRWQGKEVPVPAAGTGVSRWVGHKGPVFSLAFHPQGKMIASGGQDGVICLWDPASGKNINQIKETERVMDLQFANNDYAFFASCGSGVNIRQGPEGLRWQRFQKETGSQIMSVSFSSGGSYLATGALDGTILLWALIPDEMGDVRPAIYLRFRGHPGEVKHVSLSPDGKYLASGGREALVLWDLKEEEKRYEWKLFVRSPIIFSPDGKKMIAGVDDLTTTVWDVQSKKEIMKLPEKRSDADAIAISRDGKMLATGSWQKTIRLWDLATGKEILLKKKP